MTNSTINLNLARIIATHTINQNVFGQHSFQLTCPKLVKVEGALSEVLETTFCYISLTFTDTMGRVVGSTIKAILSPEGLKIREPKGVICNSYNGEELTLTIINPKGKVVHSQPYTKAVKVKDLGHNA